MTIRFGIAATAALLLAGCNMFPAVAERNSSEERRNESVARDRDEGGSRNTTARSDKPEQTADADATGSSDDSRGELASTMGGGGAGSGGATRAWFAGYWTDTGDCADAGEFGQDGRFVLADGGRGMWNVVSERLILQGQGGRVEVGLRRVGDDAVDVINEDGSVGRSTRC